jgi:hypothetical protein
MDRWGYAAVLAVVSLLAAEVFSADAAHAIAGTMGMAAPHGSSRQQAAANQSSTSPKSSASQKDTDPAPNGSAMHSVTVQFDYDFTKTPACSAKVTTACVQKFEVYDISGDKPYLLFSVPVPPNAQGAMKGITATSPRMLFAVGRHRIGVSAQMPNGQKSPPRDCKVIIEIKADNPPNPPASH